jgi:hypothetical protein
MTHEEVIEAISRMPLDEKLLLLQELVHVVREETLSASSAKAVADDASDGGATFPRFADLRGILESTTPPVADDAWRDDYVEDLAKKYA